MTPGSGRDGGGLLGYSLDSTRSAGHGPGVYERINLVQLVWRVILQRKRVRTRQVYLDL